MTESFYHVDRHGGLEPGSVMDLEWPSQLSEDLVTRGPEEHEDVLQELYPEGLSRHGARYSQAALVGKDGFEADGGWDLMAGHLSVENSEEGWTDTTTISPFSVQFEFQLELVRQLHFEDKLSRFQSFFAFQELDEAVEFCQIQRGGDVNIVEVECEDFEVRDMDLVEGSWFGNIISKGQDYWSGTAGSDNPMWEVVLDPPVEVVEAVDDPF